MTAAAADLRRWLVARWAWFRPRTVPCVVAGLGMLFVLKSADYLAHHKPVQHVSCSAAPTAVVHVDIAPR